MTWSAMVGNRFYVTLMIVSSIIAGLAIFWPAIERMARGQWLGGSLVAAGTLLILYLIWRQSAR